MFFLFSLTVIIACCWVLQKQGNKLVLNKKPMYLSESEPTYDPDKWNKSDFITTQNCYLYAFNDQISNLKKKPHPGFKNKVESKKKDFTCPFINKHVKMDYPDSYQTERTIPCRDGYYKIYSVVDPHKDFHFYRQDSTGKWSHKMGGADVSNKDANGDIIHDPSMSDRSYKIYDYTEPCSYMCVKSSNGS
jgi:hypothetical protein